MNVLLLVVALALFIAGIIRPFTSVTKLWVFDNQISVHSGLAKNTIVEVESGRTEPRLNTVAALAGSFGKSLSELLRGL